MQIKSQEKLRVLSAASHLTQEGCQYLLASAAHHGIDVHLIGYKDKCARHYFPKLLLSNTKDRGKMPI